MSILSKRKTPDSKLVETDRIVLNAIKSKKETAIWARDIKKETTLPNSIINKCLKNLLASSLIKEVANVKMNGRKHYIAAEFEASKEITGGSWYVNGNLDTVFINQLKDICVKIIRKLKVATADGVHEFFKTHRLTNTECSSQQISEILRCMVLENMVIEVKSSGVREYHNIPVGKVCYRCPPGGIDQGVVSGALASVPCGVCPRIRQCTPDGLISPSTCVYYARWLDF